LPDSIQPAELFNVTLKIEGIIAGSITERLPPYFTYISSSLPTQQVLIDGTNLTFLIFGEEGLNYTLQAPEEEGFYLISGSWSSVIPREKGDVVGDSAILVRCVDSDFDGLADSEEVAIGTSPNKVDTDGDGWSDFAEVAAGKNPTNPISYPSTEQPVMRTLPTFVAPSQVFNVSLEVEGISTGSIIEIIPKGFTLISTSLPEGYVSFKDNRVVFAIFGEKKINYTLRAPEDKSLIESAIFGGKWTNLVNESSGAVGGDQKLQKKLTKKEIRQQIILRILLYLGEENSEKKKQIRNQIIDLIFSYLNAS